MSGRRLQHWLSLLLWLAAAVPASAQLDDFDDGSAASDESEAAPDDGESTGAEASEDQAEDAGEGAPDTEAEAEQDAEAGAQPPGMSIQAFAGGGIGTRSFRRPVRGNSVQRLDDTLFPAIDAGLRVTAWPKDAFGLEFLLQYQTSIGMSIEQEPPFALDNDVSVRASRVALTVAPKLRLGDGPGSAALLFPIGFGLRTFWPEVHTLPVPGYTLGGPVGRVELELPFLDVVTLRFGPEVGWIVMIDQSLQDNLVGSQGVALGGEALLHVQISALIGLELAYRESHALIPTSVSSETFFDVERFVTGRLSGTW
jgi:hypothetical protein